MPVPYVPVRQDATVSARQKDFRFRNNSAGPVLIWAKSKGNTLYMALYGQTEPPKVTWQHQILRRKTFSTIYRVNRILKPGETRVVITGAEGLVVKSRLTVSYPDGRVEHKNLGTDYYKPLSHVIEKG
jgi:vancomycin resistance protein VanW